MNSFASLLEKLVAAETNYNRPRFQANPQMAGWGTAEHLSQVMHGFQGTGSTGTIEQLAQVISQIEPSSDPFTACVADRAAHPDDCYYTVIDGVQCVVESVHRFNWMGLVILPIGHPDEGCTEGQLNMRYRVHNGITFCQDGCIGFNTYGNRDYCLVRETQTGTRECHLPYRTFDFVRQQTESLAMQVAQRMRMPRPQASPWLTDLLAQMAGHPMDCRPMGSCATDNLRRTYFPREMTEPTNGLPTSFRTNPLYMDPNQMRRGGPSVSVSSTGCRTTFDCCRPAASTSAPMTSAECRTFGTSPCQFPVFTFTFPNASQGSTTASQQPPTQNARQAEQPCAQTLPSCYPTFTCPSTHNTAGNIVKEENYTSEMTEFVNRVKNLLGVQDVTVVKVDCTVPTPEATTTTSNRNDSVPDLIDLNGDVCDDEPCSNEGTDVSSTQSSDNSSDETGNSTRPDTKPAQKYLDIDLYNLLALELLRPGATNSLFPMDGSECECVCGQCPPKEKAE